MYGSSTYSRLSLHFFLINWCSRGKSMRTFSFCNLWFLPCLFVIFQKETYFPRSVHFPILQWRGRLYVCTTILHSTNIHHHPILHGFIFLLQIHEPAAPPHPFAIKRCYDVLFRAFLCTTRVYLLGVWRLK